MMTCGSGNCCTLDSSSGTPASPTSSPQVSILPPSSSSPSTTPSAALTSSTRPSRNPSLPSTTPSATPTSSRPSRAPVTPKPSDAPATSKPSYVPTTARPTLNPSPPTSAPTRTLAPVTVGPTIESVGNAKCPQYTGSFSDFSNLVVDQISCAGVKTTIRSNTCDETGDFDLFVSPKFKVVVTTTSQKGLTSPGITAAKLYNLQSGGGEITLTAGSHFPSSGGGFTVKSGQGKGSVSLSGSDLSFAFLVIAYAEISSQFYILDINVASAELNSSIPQLALSGCGTGLVSTGRLLIGVPDLPICASLDDPFDTFCNIDLEGIDDPDVQQQVFSAISNSSQMYQQLVNQTINSILSGGGEAVALSRLSVIIICFVAGLMLLL